MTNKQATHHSKDSFGIHIATVNTLQKKHRALLKEHHIGQSMRRKGNCWDNAVTESFFHSLETECVLHERYQTREQAQASIFDYIEVFYNRKRRHSANNQVSPANFESFRNVA